MPDPQAPPISLRPDRHLRPKLEVRADGQALGFVVRRDLERYYAILAHELGRIEFSQAEAAALCDVLNGTLHHGGIIPLLWAEVDDALAGGLATKWEIDGPALVAKLRALSPAQVWAVADAVERWWSGPYRDGDWSASLRAVGLLR